VTALLATEEQWRGDTTTLVMDIGTNTEISLIHRGEIMSASCPSGPALEGGHISCGMRAAEGAIERVAVELDLLDRRIRHPDRGNATAHAVGHKRHESFLTGAEGESRMPHVGRGLTQGTPAVRQVVEQQRLFTALVEQGAHLGQRIDRLIDADELSCAFQIGDPCPHVFGAHIRCDANLRFVDRVHCVRSKQSLPHSLSIELERIMERRARFAH